MARCEVGMQVYSVSAVMAGEPVMTVPTPARQTCPPTIMGKLHQFRLLLWKNYTLQKRKPFITLLEIGLPTFFAIILILIRNRLTSEEVTKPTVWQPFWVNTLPWGLAPSPWEETFRKWEIYYTPNHNITETLMEDVKKTLGVSHHNVSDNSSIVSVIKPYENETAMVNAIIKCFEQSTTLDPCPVLAGIVFVDNYTILYQLPKNITYKIRLSTSPRNHGRSSIASFLSQSGWPTEKMYPGMRQVGPRNINSTEGGDPGYYLEGFLSIQYALDMAIMRYLQPDLNNLTISTMLERFPYPPYNKDSFILIIQKEFPFIIMLSFIFSALNIVKNIVHEKERKLKESMKMMGLNNWLHWSAWFIKYFLFLFVSVALMTLFFCAPMTRHGSVIGYTSTSLLMFFLMVYAVATISFCFMLSTFFSKANSAAAAGGILFFFSYIPYFFINPHYQDMSWSAKMAACLISNNAMALGAQVIGMFEGTGAGVQWNNMDQGVSVDDNFALLHVIMMLLVDTVLYAIITWYVEAVRPGEYGIPQPWYFPLTRSYWCGTVPQGDDVSAMLSDEDERQQTYNPEYFERDPVGLRPGIRLQQLRKVFGKGGKRKVAVAGMRVNMYEGQITVLLGHNGAGKTTTMSMLTGFIPPTSGTAIVNGYDIGEDIAGVRRSLGLCPQHDVLFDTLTVEEHLIFFAKLKGLAAKDVPLEVNRMLNAIGLLSKRHALSKTLSGGMKRKLSVGIALIAGSKVVILDEPTSGMDPNARRQTWDLLQRYREGRTMVLTTHFMDEADLLGDRIAIMADGVLQCCGSSLFLKNRYGAGYHMVMVKLPECDVAQVTELVLSYVPAAQLESNVSAELSYILPQDCSHKFEALFHQIEQHKHELGIASFGASVTTMEEVFLKVGEDVDENLRAKLQQKIDLSAGNTPSDPIFNESLKKNHGVALFVQQFRAMMQKRMLHTWRNWLVSLSQLTVPLILTILALIVIRTMPSPHDSPPLTLNLDNFRSNDVMYATGVNDSAGPNANAVAAAYAAQFANTSTNPIYVNNLTEFKNNASLLNYFISKGKKNLGTYTSHYLVAAGIEEKYRNKKDHIHLSGWFNNEAYHTPAMTLNVLHNAVLRMLTNNTHFLSAVNHPLPRTVQDQASDLLNQDLQGFLVATNVIFSMAFLISSFTLFLIKERTLRAKHIQFVSGISSMTYWGATFVWDFINYLVPVFAIMIVFVSFDITAYVTSNHMGHIFLLFMLYGFGALPFMYIISFLFKTPSTGFVWITMFNILSGIATVLVVKILAIEQLGLAAIAHALDWVFVTFLPNYCLGQGLCDYYQNYEYLKLCTDPVVEVACSLPVLNISNPCCPGKCGNNCLIFTKNYLAWGSGGIGRMLVFLVIQSYLYFAILVLIESGLLRKIWYFLAARRTYKPILSVSREASIHSLVLEDDDVAKERQRIMNTPMSVLLDRDALVLTELTKYYGQFKAVDSLSVGIPQGECFGLLGINGAGKTTTFKMLSGDEKVSSGNAYVNRFNIKDDMKEVQHRLGYCPQYDALIDQLTGKETLTMYARLRGVFEEQIPTVVQTLIEALMLENHADKLVANYSGGNKRKLSTAVALVGDPPIIFLDEPTTGMDPVARRLLWDTLSRIRASGRTLVLTSHSMEECEALCTYLAVMVNGQFKCLGGPQHLKFKFGEGYTLIAKVHQPPDDSEPDILPLMDFIDRTFPQSVLKDIHQGMLHYHITSPVHSWSNIFGIMERAKERYNIEDYSVSQTTLEQVFLNFARAQVTPQEEKPTQRCACCARWCCCCHQVEDEEDELRNLVVDTDDELIDA